MQKKRVHLRKSMLTNKTYFHNIHSQSQCLCASIAAKVHTMLILTRPIHHTRIIQICLTHVCWKRNVLLNPWWPSDTIWRHRFGSILAQVMTYCLTSCKHYLNLSWLIIDDIHLRAISQQIPQVSMNEISLTITFIELSLGLWIRTPERVRFLYRGRPLGWTN